MKQHFKLFYSEVILFILFTPNKFPRDSTQISVSESLKDMGPVQEVATIYRWYENNRFVRQREKFLNCLSSLCV